MDDASVSPVGRVPPTGAPGEGTEPTSKTPITSNHTLCLLAEFLMVNVPQRILSWKSPLLTDNGWIKLPTGMGFASELDESKITSKQMLTAKYGAEDGGVKECGTAEDPPAFRARLAQPTAS